MNKQIRFFSYLSLSDFYFPFHVTTPSVLPLPWSTVGKYTGVLGEEDEKYGTTTREVVTYPDVHRISCSPLTTSR